MTLVRRLAAALLLVIACAAVAPAAQSQPPQPPGEFLPVDELPVAEAMPAAPLLIGAYAFVLAVLFGYLVSVGRRLSVVQREVERLETDLKRSGGRA